MSAVSNKDLKIWGDVKIHGPAFFEREKTHVSVQMLASTGSGEDLQAHNGVTVEEWNAATPTERMMTFVLLLAVTPPFPPDQHVIDQLIKRWAEDIDWRAEPPLFANCIPYVETFL